MEYRVVTVSDKVELEKLINDYLKLGWELLGGIDAAYRSSGPARHWRFSQAIIKKEEDK